MGCKYKKNFLINKVFHRPNAAAGPQKRTAAKKNNKASDCSEALF